MPTSEAAVAYLRRRQRILARLERVNAALTAWAEYDANTHLPDDLKREVRRPELSREALTGLHAMLVEELARLDIAERVSVLDAGWLGHATSLERGGALPM